MKWGRKVATNEDVGVQNIEPLHLHWLLRLYALCPMLLVPVIQRRLPISGEWGVFEIRAAATEQLFFGSLND